MRVQSPGQEDPLEEEMETYTPVILPRTFYRQGSLVVYSPWGLKELGMT